MSMRKNLVHAVSVRENGTRRQVLDCSGDKGRTRQEMKDECDVNVIVSRYRNRLIDPDLLAKIATFGDARPVSFQDAVSRLHEGEEAFFALPASVRKHFDHDAAKFVDFASNPENADALVDLGLAERKVKPVVAPTAAEIGEAVAGALGGANAPHA